MKSFKLYYQSAVSFLQQAGVAQFTTEVAKAFREGIRRELGVNADLTSLAGQRLWLGLSVSIRFIRGEPYFDIVLEFEPYKGSSNELRVPAPGPISFSSLLAADPSVTDPSATQVTLLRLASPKHYSDLLKEFKDALADFEGRAGERVLREAIRALPGSSSLQDYDLYPIFSGEIISTNQGNGSKNPMFRNPVWGVLGTPLWAVYQPDADSRTVWGSHFTLSLASWVKDTVLSWLPTALGNPVTQKAADQVRLTGASLCVTHTVLDVVLVDLCLTWVFGKAILKIFILFGSFVPQSPTDTTPISLPQKVSQPAVWARWKEDVTAYAAPEMTTMFGRPDIQAYLTSEKPLSVALTRINNLAQKSPDQWIVSPAPVVPKRKISRAELIAALRKANSEE